MAKARWRTHLSKVIRFSNLLGANGWHRICRVWHSIIRFPKLFEALLVLVGVLQGYVLWRTDQALHLAANAQQTAVGTADKMRLIIEATDRPWIGPINASIEGPLEQGKRISTRIFYQNTGRQPSPVFITTSPKLFTRQQLKNEIANGWILGKQQECMTTSLPVNLIQTRIAFPTLGFSAYQLRVDSDDRSIAPSERFLATEAFMSGDEIFIFVGCFVYGTTEIPHHSSFCYFYDSKDNISDIHSLSYCLVGQRAD